MQKNSLAFVRSEMLTSQPPPRDEAGVLCWIRKNLFSSANDALLTVLGLVILAYVLPPILRWAIIDAQWTGTDRTFCATVSQGGLRPDGWSGACWAFVNVKIEQFLFGRYPIGERWRVVVCAGAFLCLFLPLLMPSVPRKAANAIALFGVFPIFAFFLLVGGSFGLSPVETPLWGGLMVTLILSIVGIAVSLPLGILLALGRRSEMPFVRYICVGFIETVRGVPLVTVLFMASVMLPLFLPQGFSFDKLMRALIGVALFSSAYMAEVVRGGLQAISKGQYEGADSLGLGYWQKMGFVVLPQAVKLVIPGIVNSFIGIFKDTSLVYIIGMFDLLGAVRQNFSDANWASPQTPTSGLVFAGFVFWLFCFSMSRYSIYMERRLNTGHQR